MPYELETEIIGWYIISICNLVIKKRKKKKDRVLTNPYSSNEFVTFACSWDAQWL